MTVVSTEPNPPIIKHLSPAFRVGTGGGTFYIYPNNPTFFIFKTIVIVELYSL